MISAEFAQRVGILGRVANTAINEAVIVDLRQYDDLTPEELDAMFGTEIQYHQADYSYDPVLCKVRIRAYKY